MTNHALFPTEADWVDYERDLDTRYAHDAFAGKSLEEVLSMLYGNALGTSESFYYMPAVPFRFYIKAFEQFLQDDKFLVSREWRDTRGIAAATDSFFDLIEFKLKQNQSDVMPIVSELLLVAEYLAAKQELLEIDLGIYGSLPDRLQLLKNLYSQNQS